MSEVKKELIEAIADLLPKLDDFNRGRLLGRAEGLADAADSAEKEPTTDR